MVKGEREQNNTRFNHFYFSIWIRIFYNVCSVFFSNFFVSFHLVLLLLLMVSSISSSSYDEGKNYHRKMQYKQRCVLECTCTGARVALNVKLTYLENRFIHRSTHAQTNCLRVDIRCHSIKLSGMKLKWNLLFTGIGKKIWNWNG